MAHQWCPEHANASGGDAENCWPQDLFLISCIQDLRFALRNFGTAPTFAIGSITIREEPHPKRTMPAKEGDGNQAGVPPVRAAVRSGALHASLNRTSCPGLK
ncbi:MAG: hypothetical protein DMG57_03240 [Acidobacteria bacterium]|nr:MAG: hypothetical protein DMG57_03240 [Acidobacteriota bacterium]